MHFASSPKVSLPRPPEPHWRSLHWPWLSVTLAGVIVVWWFLFLVVNPRLFDEYIAQAQREGRDWGEELGLDAELRERFGAAPPGAQPAAQGAEGIGGWREGGEQK